MKVVKTYYGELYDDSIEEVLPSLIEEAKHADDFMYLNWNGFFILIDKDSTVDGCLDQYYEKISKDGVYGQYKRGELIDVDDLGKRIANYLKNL